ncbi:ABC transporter substrate-binding protein [Mameliella sediminis]|uniref:ABC transporter substrate-binding protein n=1 Tax=Mameliella sediminis TaxID=2836866 RepID=UPI001C47E335|nr:ABC transporter substrate-binding protein [Mameliella sediminis]MBV7397290.1 ABC transporter substrate-binding protein [Mameliella sediminis]MBY6163815.1 ABC transporter substrate-binding protein [Mameliella alba]MBY6172226.1 ABC transporter substrate-binding protein [Mameliella alba]MBY6177302.1 ABC transporter substrate-binding protein [Mameliella alba]
MKTPLRLVAAALTGFALMGAPAQADTPPNVLVVAQNIDDIVALDPAQAYEFTSSEYMANVYDRLVQYDAEDTTKLVGGLAESWEIDAENRTITFTLRDGVSFHSGNALSAADVIYSFKRVVALNKNPAFILTQLGWTAENIQDMVSGDGKTVTLKYAGDFSPAFVMNVLAARPASIVDSQLVMANEVDGDMGNAWLNTNSAGSGAFSMQMYRPAEMLRLVANPDYYKGAPKMQQIIIRHVAEAATQQLLLEQGDVDIARNMTPEQIAALPEDGFKVGVYPQAAIHFISFNQKVPALQHEALWEASRYLIDYKGLTDTLLKGQMDVHQAFWPKGFPGALEDTPFSYDPEKAKQILADAGVELPINVEMDVFNFAPFTDVAQSIQASFAEADINFDIVPGTTAAIITKYRAREHEAIMLYWGPDFNDPHSNAKAFAYNKDNSDDGYASTTTWRNAWAVSKEMNERTMAALTESDPAKREEMYLSLQKDVQAKAPFVIMFQATLQVGMDADVDGYVHGASSDLVFYRLVEKN